VAAECLALRIPPTGALARTASRAMLMLVDRVPALKRQFFLSMAAE
jgi:hypothetical protein